MWDRLQNMEHEDAAIALNTLGMICYQQGNSKHALSWFKGALPVYEKIYGPDDSRTAALRHNIEAAYLKTLPIEECIFTATVVDGDTPARRQQMSGEYIVLEYGDWNIESTVILFDRLEELNSKPRYLTVMKDGIISRHFFESGIGITMNFKQVEAQEKQEIIHAYRQFLNADGK